MKCPKCGINYDDSDRECPMCGAPKPLFAKDKSQLAKTTARPANTDNKNTDPMGSILDLGSKKKSSWSKSEKSSINKIAIIVIIAVLIINFIPSLISVLSNILSNVAQDVENVTVQVEPVPDEISVYLTNSYILDDNEIQFNIFNDGTYSVMDIELSEWGDIITYQYDIGEVPELETILLNNSISTDDFNIKIAILKAVNSTEDKYIIIAESYNNEQTFFYDLNSNINWLDDGVFVEGFIAA